MTDKRHTYSIRVDWTGNQGTGTSAYRAYSRAHEISAQGKTAIAGSSNPVFRGDAARWNPAELLIAAKRVADLALERRLPAASTTRAFVDAGGLMSYGADGPALFRLGAKFVHRILQGRQPNDLPIEQPTKFELAVNLKTAKAIGITIPESFLLRADALIE